MRNNNSPWLHQLNVTRPVDVLTGDTSTDIAIVGAGIAGIMTAYFTLKHTDKKVLLVEAGRVAHGATGHNAGQIVFEFEREFHSLVEEYGLDLSAEAERSVRNAWILLEEIYQDASLTTPMSSFMGYNGFATVERVLEEMRNNILRSEAGLPTAPIYIADNSIETARIPHEYSGLYSAIPHADILALLETNDRQYVAVTAEKKGCVNSALLVEEIVGYMLSVYKERFVLVEETPIAEVILEKYKASLHTSNGYNIQAERVVMCTNGFEKFTIINNVEDESETGTVLNTAFHKMVHGSVGYMAGYLEELKHPPIALSYFDAKTLAKKLRADTIGINTYYYMTRRPYEVEKNEKHNLVCVGGPEQRLHHVKEYIPSAEYSVKAAHDINTFLHTTYAGAPKKDINFKFKWHGLMGYTPTSLRVVGPEPRNPVLMYNLGCNGVGILTSIHGGKKIAEILAGVQHVPSLFDPRREY